METVAAIFKSLADETRLRIMGLLLDVEELCVCHIISALQLPQSTISRHLATLKNAGWLKDRRSGVWVHYSIASDLSAVHRNMIGVLHTVFEKNKTVQNDKKRLEEAVRTDCCT